MRDSTNFLLAGVGGQGTILASDVLVNLGLAAGYQAKQAEVHGMSQRGGSVTSFVRWGRVVYSPWWVEERWMSCWRLKKLKH